MPRTLYSKRRDRVRVCLGGGVGLGVGGLLCDDERQAARQIWPPLYFRPI